MRKIVGLLLTFTLFFTIGMTAVAAPAVEDEYREILADVNEEYGVELGYGAVDVSKVSLEEYEEFVRSVAQQQKELAELIANREENQGTDETVSLASTVLRKTVIRPVWGTYAAYFDIQAGYTVTDDRITAVNSLMLIRNDEGYYEGYTYQTYDNYPTYHITDSGRTLQAIFYGTLKKNLIIQIENVQMYSEFAYSSW